jgi:uncharacterized SAM-binding protein YcdF (DUF218 family)
VTYIQPVLPLLLASALFLLAFGRKSPHFGRRMALVCILLLLWSLVPVATLFSGTLEWWYPVRRYPPGEAQAIVVLSAGVYSHDASEPEDLPNASTFLRTNYAAWLYQNWRQLPIVVSGGAADAKKVSLSGVMSRLLEQRGVPVSMIWREDRSRSTYENAVYSAELLRARGINRIVLVTEAPHMLRAERAFRKQNLAVLAAPCCYRTLQFSGRWPEFLPQARAVVENEDTLHEWIGVLWYVVSGKM